MSGNCRRRTSSGVSQWTSPVQHGYGQQPYIPPPGYQQSYRQHQYGQPPPDEPPPYEQPSLGLPVIYQPGAPLLAQWMPQPQRLPGCPPGLEYLMQVDQILVKQQVEIFEVITGWETANKYEIKNSMGQQVFFAAEESSKCSRQCSGPSRGFVIHITDNTNQEVIRVTREFKCCAGCCWCACSDFCATEITVEAPVGQVAGYVRQTKSCIEPRYSILNVQGVEVLKIQGPACALVCPWYLWDHEFKVFSGDEEYEVGKISKQWSGWMRELFTDADNFGVTFPLDLNIKMKAVMIGAVFLIDFMFFESRKKGRFNRNS